MVKIMEEIILKKLAFKKIKKIAKRKFDREDKEVIGFLIGYFHENSIEIKDIIVPDQTASKISVKVEEEVSLVNALIKSNKKGMYEICVGWFHSHPPGYGCFLSATDIETQMYWQRVNPRNIALVYDPLHREIKVFRTKKENDLLVEKSRLALPGKNPRAVRRGIAEQEFGYGLRMDALANICSLMRTLSAMREMLTRPSGPLGNIIKAYK